jgi:hypothetical protein
MPLDVRDAREALAIMAALCGLTPAAVLRTRHKDVATLVRLNLRHKYDQT